MLKVDFITRILLFLILLSPLLSYIYTVWLGLPKTITQFYVFLVFIYGLLFLFLKKIKIPLFAKFLLIFALYRIAWKLLLIIPEKQILTIIYYYIQDLALFLIILLIYNTTFKEKYIKLSVTIIKYTVIIAAIVSIIQVFNMDFLSPNNYFFEDYENKENIYTFRRSSIFGFIDSNAAGIAFIPLLSTLIGYLLVKKEKNYVLYLILGGIVAILTNGRYVIIGFLIISVQVLFYNKVTIKGFIKYFVIAVLMIFLLIKSLSLLGYNFQEWYDQRLLSEGSIEETTRYKAIGNFINFFPKTPIFGTGDITEEIKLASKAVGSSHIHVGYLSHLVYYGIFGCFFLFGFWFLLMRKYYFTARRTNYWGSFFGFLMFLWAFATMSQSYIFFHGIIFTMVFDKFFSNTSLSNNEMISLNEFKE